MNTFKLVIMVRRVNQLTRITKRLSKNIMFLFIAAVTLNACNKKCDCTNESCPCFPFTISVYANANNSAEGSFATNEMSGFHLLRTNENFELIDSLKIEFTNLYSSLDYNKVYRFSAETFTNIIDIRPFNFIIRNTILNTTDTISSISYDEEMESVLCNKCTNCDDEYLDCVVFDNINLELNCEVQEKAEIAILRRPN